MGVEKLWMIHESLDATYDDARPGWRRETGKCGFEMRAEKRVS